MKRRAMVFLLFCLAALLWGCGAEETTAPLLLTAAVAEDAGFTVEQNGLTTVPGGSVTFTLIPEEGYGITGADYEGPYILEAGEDGRMLLTLQSVAYPTRVHLTTTNRYCTLTYDGNGAAEEPFTVTCDRSKRQRPNTELGTDRFTREGYTLICWNTRRDSLGTRVGLGSRVTVTGSSLTLYACWVPQTESSAFTFEEAEGGLAIIGYTGSHDSIVIPQEVNGTPVAVIRAGAFEGCGAHTLILSPALVTVEDGAFRNCSFTTITLYDNLEDFSDESFSGCESLRTLYINAVEKPYGYLYRQESCYADKIDLLINCADTKRAVFYGGCSMWYNLNGRDVQKALGTDYTVVNVAINGTVNAVVQMEILEALLREGDILFHTPEISSGQQLLQHTEMTALYDPRLWCGLENNYDLFALADLQKLSGAFTSLAGYLKEKKSPANYRMEYRDELDRSYCDALGCIPWGRGAYSGTKSDKVFLDPKYLAEEGLSRLTAYYDAYAKKGVHVYVSYACINMDVVPEEQQQNLTLMDALLRERLISSAAAVISHIADHVITTADTYDTHYHLSSEASKRQTGIWIRDLLAAMEQDGLL